MRRRQMLRAVRSAWTAWVRHVAAEAPARLQCKFVSFEESMAHLDMQRQRDSGVISISLLVFPFAVARGLNV